MSDWRRGARRSWGALAAGEAEVRKGPVYHGALGDRCDDANASAATVTFLKIDGESPLEQLLPAHR